MSHVQEEPAGPGQYDANMEADPFDADFDARDPCDPQILVRRRNITRMQLCRHVLMNRENMCVH